MKKQDTITIKGEIIFTKRRVPNFLIPLEKVGLYKIVNTFSPVISKSKYSNLVCTAGKNTIVSRWVGDTTKTGILTYLALGTGTGTPTSADVKLGTEVYRKLLTTRTKDGITAKTSTYIPTNEGNYTYKEVGLYGDDATGTPDSGTLYTHASVNEEKTEGVSVTIDYNLKIT